MSRTQSLFNVLSVVTVVALWVIPETSLGRAAPAPGGHHPIFFGGDNTPGYPLLNTSGVGEPQVSGPGRLQVTIAPNPFRGSTRFSFNLQAGEEGRLRIYSTSGRLLREFRHVAGVTGLTWDGRDASSKPVRPGLYYVQI